MRILCAQCSAAYSIDDRVVTERGVRAQCPQCGHLQLVKKSDRAEVDSSARTIQELSFSIPGSAPSTNEGSLGGFDFLAPPTDARGAALNALGASGGGGGSGTGAGSLAPAALDTGGDWNSPSGPPGTGRDVSPFDFSALPSAAPTAELPLAGAERAPPTTEAPHGFAPARGAAAPPSHLAPAAPAAFDAPDAATPRCASCGKVLSDAFDLALGTCDRCREQPPSAPAASAQRPSQSAMPALRPSQSTMPAPRHDAPRGAPAASAQPGRAAARTDAWSALHSAPQTGPAAPARADGPPRLSPEVATQPEPHTAGAAAAAGPLRGQPQGRSGPATAPDWAVVAPSAAHASHPDHPVPPAPSRADDASIGANEARAGSTRLATLLRTRRAAIAGAVAALVLVGTVVAVVRAVSREDAPALVEKPPPVSASAPEPIEAVLKVWRVAYPELQGEPASQATELLESGLAALRLDTPRGYVEAEEAFKKALLLDPSSEAAVQGWGLALAFGRSGSLEETTARSAERMATYFEQRGGAARTYAAHAHLVIARGGPANDVQSLAARALATAKSNDDRALALLAMGQAELDKNSQEAEKAFERAMATDPGLKRAHFFRARLLASVGRYAEAIESLKARLALDEDQWEASLELTKLLVDLGQASEAKRVLHAASAAAVRNAGPRTALGVLAYQHLADPDGALEIFGKVTSDVDLPRGALAAAWAHAAAAWRMKGNLDKALSAATAALDLIEDHGPALLQRCLIHLDRRVASLARLDFEAVKARIPREDLARAVEGRILVAEGRFDEAVAMLGTLAEQHPYRVDALLLAGSAAAKARQDGKAWEFCLKRALRADPFSSTTGPMMDYFVRPVDVLRPAIGAYDALARGGEDDPNPVLCEGLVAWTARDLVAADARFARVLAINASSGEAAAYRAFVAIERGDFAAALRSADRAVAVSRTLALGYLAKALALRGLQKFDQAKEPGRSAEKFAPKLGSVRVFLGDMEARAGNKLEARELLTGALLNEPYSRDAKRVLFENRL